MKRFILILSCLLLLLAAPLPALAAQPKIVDEAWLLTEDQVLALEEKAQDLTDRYGMDVVIVTMDSIGYTDIETYADDYYDHNGYGIGPDYSGILLMISMEYREWAISTCGEAIYCFTDYGIESLFSEMAWYLSEDEFYLALDAYLSAMPQYFEAYERGEPIDGYSGGYDGPGSYEPGTKEDIVYYPEHKKPSFFTVFATSLVIGLVAGGIGLLFLRSQMKTVRRQAGAHSYIAQDTASLTRMQDIYLYSNVSRVARPQDNSHHHSGRGGSSVHFGGGGRSHGGGHGRF